MSDDLPTPERLGRIERGVQRRIDRRRQVVRQIAGASVAVVLVVGGVALARPLLMSSSSGASSAAGGGTVAGTSAENVTTVVCHDGSVTRTVRARGALPASALTACATAVTEAAPAARPGDLGSTPSPTPTPVLCESTKGVVHVYLRDAATCTTHKLLPYSE